MRSSHNSSTRSAAIPTYILLHTLQAEGREMMLANPDALLHAQHEIEVVGVQCLGTYGVLGRYDFVTIVEAPDNDAIARFSLELGVNAGVHIETLPAVPLGQFHRRDETRRGSDPRRATLDN